MARVYSVEDLLNDDAVDRDGEPITLESTVALTDKIVVEKTDGTAVEITVATLLSQARNASGIRAFADLRINPNRITGDTLPEEIKIQLGEKITTKRIVGITFEFQHGQEHSETNLTTIDAIVSLGEWDITLAEAEITAISNAILDSHKNLSSTFTIAYLDSTSETYNLYISVNDDGTPATVVQLNIEKGRITELDTALDVERARITAVAANIASAQSRITNLGSDISVESGRITDLQTSFRQSIRTFDTLPDATNFANGQVILVDGRFYRNHSTPAANTLSGEVGVIGGSGVSIKGLRLPDGPYSSIGRWTSNPNHVVSWLIDENGSEITFAVLRSAYRTAKTSNEADEDQLTLDLTIDGTTESVTVTIADASARTYTNSDGEIYLIFRGSITNSFILHTASENDEITIIVKRGGNEFITHAAELAHWVLEPVESEDVRSLDVSTGNMFPASASIGAWHLFDAAATNLTDAVGTDGSTAKTSAQALDLFEFTSHNWKYIGFIGTGNDGVISAISLDTDDTLIVDRTVGAQLQLNLARLRHIRLITVTVDTGNNLQTAGIDNHAETYGDNDQYEFRSPILNTGPVQLRVQYSNGGQLLALAYKPILDIHGHALTAGILQINELIQVRFDTEVDAWISNIYPLATNTNPGLISANQYNKILRSVLSFDQLPDATMYDADQLIFVNGKFYRNSETSAANLIEGNIARTGLTRGISYANDLTNALGEWTSNPDHAVSSITVAQYDASDASEGLYVVMLIKQSSYEAAKGSAVADNDTLAVTIAAGDNTETLTLTYDHDIHGIEISGVNYLFFTSRATTTLLWSEDAGTSITVLVRQGGSDFITHAANMAHWLETVLYVDKKQLPPGFTISGSFPSVPQTNEKHLFDTAASALTNAENENGTSKTTAQALDLFKYNGNAWVYVGFLGNTTSKEYLYNITAVSQANKSVALTEIGTMFAITTGTANRTITFPNGATNGDALGVLKADAGNGDVIIKDASDNTLLTLENEDQTVTYIYDGSGWQPISVIGFGGGGTALSPSQIAALSRAPTANPGNSKLWSTNISGNTGWNDPSIPIVFKRWDGGVVENQNAYEIDMNISNAPIIDDGIDGMDLYVIATIIIDGGGGILDVLQAENRIASRTVHNRQPIKAFAKIGRNNAGQYAAAAIKAKFTASSQTTVLGMRCSLLAIPGFGVGEIADNTAAILLNSGRLDNWAENLLHDLKPGNTIIDWNEVADVVLGLSTAGNAGSFSLASAIALTYTHRLGTSSYGFGGKWTYARIPSGANPAHYRLRRFHNLTNGITPYYDYEHLTNMYPLGNSGAFDYYQSHDFVGDFVEYSMEVTTSSHSGTTTYSGNLVKQKVLDAADIPAIVTLTQAQYTELTSKDSDTLYIIVG